MKTAIWLLDRFDVPESVTGDIIERSRGAKSRWWLWQQAIAAIVARSLHEARRHPWVALRGVALGVLLVCGAEAALRFTNLPFDQWLGRALYDYLNVSRPMMLLLVSFGNALVVAPCWFAIGWLIARWHPRVVALIPLAFRYSEQLPVYIRQTLYEVTAPHSAVYKAVHITGMTVWLATFTATLLAGAFCVKRDTRSLV